MPRNTVASQKLLDQAQQFPDTFAGAARAAEYVARAVVAGGIPWAADRAALAVYLEALWLLRNGHQQGPIFAVASYTSVDRVLVLYVGDRGRELPAVDPHDQQFAEREGLLGALAASIGPVEPSLIDSGRVLAASFTVRGAFVVRTSWQDPPYGAGRYVYQDFATQAEARAAAWDAVEALGSVREGSTLSAVHLQGPDDEDSRWARAEREGVPGDALALSSGEVADLTRAALRACSFDWAERRADRPGVVVPTDLMGLLRAEQPSFRISEAALRQFAQSVVSARTLPGPLIRDPHLALVALAHSHASSPLLGLHEQLAAAWGTCQEELGRQVALDLFKDQELAELLTVAECYQLIARDPHTGLPRIAPNLGALGAAGALVAECLLAGSLRLREDACLASTGAGTVARMSQPARELVQTVEAEGPLEIGKWLKYLSLSASRDLEHGLLEADVLCPGAAPARRLFTRTEPGPVPADAGLVPRILSHVLGPTRAPDKRRVEAAVLLALARASTLDRADRDTAWWLADTDEDIADLLNQADAGLPLLIEHVTAAVTSAVATGRR